MFIPCLEDQSSGGSKSVSSAKHSAKVTTRFAMYVRFAMKCFARILQLLLKCSACSLFKGTVSLDFRYQFLFSMSAYNLIYYQVLSTFALELLSADLILFKV